MQAKISEYHSLVKFIVTSAAFFFVGAIHGVVQTIHPVRVWLDSIGSPYGGPGHMIDPLAHAHINLLGGVVVLLMAFSYYILPKVTERPIYSRRLQEHSYWWTTIGICCFYSTLMIFGIWEGMLWLDHPEQVPEVHKYYPPVIGTASTIMGMGLWIYFANLFLSARNYYREVKKS